MWKRKRLQGLKISLKLPFSFYRQLLLSIFICTPKYNTMNVFEGTKCVPLTPSVEVIASYHYVWHQAFYHFKQVWTLSPFDTVKRHVVQTNQFLAYSGSKQRSSGVSLFSPFQQVPGGSQGVRSPGKIHIQFTMLKVCPWVFSQEDMPRKPLKGGAMEES